MEYCRERERGGGGREGGEKRGKGRERRQRREVSTRGREREVTERRGREIVNQAICDFSASFQTCHGKSGTNQGKGEGLSKDTILLTHCGKLRNLAILQTSSVLGLRLV